MEEHPERYWHVHVQLAAAGTAKGRESLVNDLSFAELTETVITPWRDSRPFTISGLIIRDQSQVAAIKVTQTNEPLAAYAAAHDRKMDAGGIMDWATNRKVLPIWYGQDFTQILLFAKGQQTAHVEKLTATSNRIFLVHGRDEELKAATARTLERLSLKAIILDEQPGKSRTIMEKFIDYSDVQFAIVLLSPDDEGRIRSEDSKLCSRARQNVIFELGFFIGKLGRERVAALYRKEANFELPSDFSAVHYIEYNAKGTWRFELCRELAAAGYTVDANRLLA